jgi:hypothetical protein
MSKRIGHLVAVDLEFDEWNTSLELLLAPALVIRNSLG